MGIRTCLQCGETFAHTKWPSRFCRACGPKRHNHNGRSVAGALVAKAIREGRLKPAACYLCVDCGARAREYDHRDYNQPLKVEPVCRTCNRRRGPGKWVRYTPLRDLLRAQQAAA